MQPIPVRTRMSHALALVHAALDDTSPERVRVAREYLDEWLPLMRRVSARSARSKELLELLVRLTAAMDVLTRKLEGRTTRWAS
jgi:hypothetical protein